MLRLIEAHDVARPTLARAVVALSLAETASWGILYYACAVLLRPIAEELRTSEATVAGAFSLGLLTSGVVAARVGRAVDRHGPRGVMTIAAGVGAISLLLLSTVTDVAQLYLASLLLGLAQAGTLYEPAFAAVTSWFPDRRERLRALLVLVSVAGLASTIFVPATAALVAALGWRAAVVALAGILAAVVVPLFATLPGAPGASRAAIVDEPPARSGAPARRVGGEMRLAVVFALHAIASTGAAVHLVAFLEDAGATPTRAASIAGLLGLSQVGGRLLSGRVHELVPAHARLPAILAVQAASIGAVTIGLGASTPIAVIVFGAANGLMTLERATLPAERFGTARFGEISGRIARLGLVGRAGAPLAVSLASLHAGRNEAFWGLAGLLATGAVFSCVHRARGASFDA